MENFNCYFFTSKEGIATKLWPKKVVKYFSLNLNLVKNPYSTVNKYKNFPLIQDYLNWALRNWAQLINRKLNIVVSNQKDDTVNA